MVGRLEMNVPVLRRRWSEGKEEKERMVQDDTGSIAETSNGLR